MDETAAPPPPEDPPLFDEAGNEPEGGASRADSRALAAAANGVLVEKPAADDADDPLALAPEVESTPADAHTDTNDQFTETPKPEPEQQTADEWPWAEEFAARA